MANTKPRSGSIFDHLPQPDWTADDQPPPDWPPDSLDDLLAKARKTGHVEVLLRILVPDVTDPAKRKAVLKEADKAMTKIAYALHVDAEQRLEQRVLAARTRRLPGGVIKRRSARQIAQHLHCTVDKVKKILSRHPAPRRHPVKITIRQC